MKSEKKLTLDQERLVRLQNDQLDAATGGAEGNGSTTIVVDVPILSLRGDAEATANAEGSCCNKSC